MPPGVGRRHRNLDLAIPADPHAIEFTEWEGRRNLLNRALAPTQLFAFRDRARTFTSQLIDQHIASGQMNLVLDLANPVPAIVTMELVVSPSQDWKKFADPFHAYPSSRADTDEHGQAVEGI